MGSPPAQYEAGGRTAARHFSLPVALGLLSVHCCVCARSGSVGRQQIAFCLKALHISPLQSANHAARRLVGFLEDKRGRRAANKVGEEALDVADDEQEAFKNSKYSLVTEMMRQVCLYQNGVGLCPYKVIVSFGSCAGKELPAVTKFEVAFDSAKGLYEATRPVPTRPNPFDADTHKDAGSSERVVSEEAE